MPAKELRIANRTAYFRKAISSPDFSSERVLVHDAFEYCELWLKRTAKKALPFWRQAKHYYIASRNLPSISAPLTLYYSFLNATKALLIVKRVSHGDYHGVAGNVEASKRSLYSEKIQFLRCGVVASLSKHLEEKETAQTHTLKDVLANLPFVHRAFRHTFRSHPETFIPLRNVVYRKHPLEDRVWISADVNGRFADARSMATLPEQFERDLGFPNTFTIRTKKRANWAPRGTGKKGQREAFPRLQALHKKARCQLTYISASPDLWYIKRHVSGAQIIDRYNLTLIIAAMHRLSELSRYDPDGFSRHLDSQSAWLLTEFIRHAPNQFFDELVCEMTGLGCGLI